MKVFNNIIDLAKELNKKVYEVEDQYRIWMGRNYMYVDDTEIMMHVVDNEIHFILFDHNNDKECKEYMMKYELNDYVWKVYVDDIEKWQPCKVIDINNTRMGIDRATVICESGTQLNRRVKFVIDEEDEDFKADGCIYFYEDIEE